jgi:hypothetical protein
LQIQIIEIILTLLHLSLLDSSPLLRARYARQRHVGSALIGKDFFAEHLRALGKVFRPWDDGNVSLCLEPSRALGKEFSKNLKKLLFAESYGHALGKAGNLCVPEFPALPSA